MRAAGSALRPHGPVGRKRARHPIRAWRRALTLVAAVGLAAGCGDAPEARILRVERGLLASFGDPPWKRMTLAERMAHHDVPGVAIAVINDFSVEWSKGYGVLRAGGTRAVTPDTLFQPASIAKVAVAVAALGLVEQGVLELDADVNRRLVSWKVPDNEFTARGRVTLRRLLSHSAGVTVRGFRGYAQGEEVPDVRQVLDGRPPANSAPIRVDTAPGTIHRYSGGGYMIAQQLLEDVAGKPLPRLLRESVLEPLAMTSSTFEPTLPPARRPHAAAGHRADGSTIPGGWHTYPEVGAGGSMWSTATDIARFAIAVMQAYAGRPEAVLSQDMAALMLTPQIDSRGLGPVLGDDGGDRFYFLHPGANDGYKSVLVAYPKRGQGVVILTNSDRGEALWREILNSVSVEYGWVEDRTAWYAAAAVVLLVAVAAVVGVRRRRTSA